MLSEPGLIIIHNPNISDKNVIISMHLFCDEQKNLTHFYQGIIISFFMPHSRYRNALADQEISNSEVDVFFNQLIQDIPVFIIQEMYQESLLLLKRKFHWRLTDILYLKKVWQSKNDTLAKKTYPKHLIDNYKRYLVAKQFWFRNNWPWSNSCYLLF